MQELNLSEVAQVNGAGTAEWGVSIGAATAFVGMAIAIGATAPIGAGVLAGASIASSMMAIYHKLN
ncbi:MAG: hypothetical protein ACFHVJ_03855 [Aestuariibacter sp.]